MTRERSRSRDRAPTRAHQDPEGDGRPMLLTADLWTSPVYMQVLAHCLPLCEGASEENVVIAEVGQRMYYCEFIVYPEGMTRNVLHVSLTGLNDLGRRQVQARCRRWPPVELPYRFVNADDAGLGGRPFHSAEDAGLAMSENID